MATLKELQVVVKYNANELNRGLQQSQQSVDRLVQKLGGQNVQSLMVSSTKAADGLKEAGQAAQKSSSMMATLSGQIGSLVAAYISVTGVIRLAHEAWADLSLFIQSDVAINRVLASMDALGIAADGMRARLEASGWAFMRVGQRQEAAFDGYRRLIQATGDTEEAQGLLNDALAFAVRQGVDVESVVSAINKAYGNQGMLLKRLLLDYMGTGKEVKNFAEAMELLRKGGEKSEKALGDNALMLYRIQTNAREAKEEVGAAVAHWIRKFDELQAWIDTHPAVAMMLQGVPTLRRIFLPAGPERPAAIAGPEVPEEIRLKNEARRKAELEKKWRDKVFKDEGDATQKSADNRESIARILLDKLKRLTLEEYEYRRWALDQEVAAFEKAGMDKAMLADYFAAASKQIAEEEVAHRLKVLEDIRKEQKRAADQMEADWRDAHAQELEWTERFANGFGNEIGQMVANGKASLESFRDFFKNLLAGILGDVIASRIRAALTSLIPGYGGWNQPQTMPTPRGPLGPAERPGGGMWAGSYGGRGGLPAAMPVPVVNVAPTTPTIYLQQNIRSDVSDVGCETVVTRGLTRIQRIGR